MRALIDKLQDLDKDFNDSRTEAKDLAQKIHSKLQEYNKSYYDKRHKKCTKYQKGDLVMVSLTI